MTSLATGTIFGMIIAFSFLTLTIPVYAQGGLSVTLSSQCIVTNPATTVTIGVATAVQGSPAGSQTVTVATVGSIPKDTNVTITPTSGTAPYNATVTIHVLNFTAAIGSYQLGVIARLGTESRISLFTLHIVQAGQGQTPCSKLGLPLPESTFIVTLTSLGLGLLTQVVTRRFVDLDKERRMKAELSAFNKEKREAAASKDKTKLEKLKKRELPMRQAQSKVSLARTKVTFITIVPLFAVYYLMASFLGGYGAIVAVSPIPIPYLVGTNGEMVLIWWYIIGSFTLSSILTRLLHTTT